MTENSIQGCSAFNVAVKELLDCYCVTQEESQAQGLGDVITLEREVWATAANFAEDMDRVDDLRTRPADEIANLYHAFLSLVAYGFALFSEQSGKPGDAILVDLVARAKEIARDDE